MSLLREIGQWATQLSGIVGTTVDLLGTLYMAYDLFGQRHGPLRILTETITYVVVGTVLGSLALGVIAFDAVQFDPYFVQTVTVSGAISVLLAFGFTGGFGAGLGYVLTTERKWNSGQPKYKKDRQAFRVVVGLAIGIFEGLLVYVVMANFRNVQDVSSGLFWGMVQGPPAGLLFGFLVARLQIHFNKQTLHRYAKSDQERMASPEHLTQAGVILTAGNMDPSSQKQAVDDQLVRGEGTKLERDQPVVISKAVGTSPFDTASLLSGIATGLGVGPITALSYFALYGPFVPQTFISISIAGIVGGTGLGFVLATAERTLLWIDHLPPKRLGIAGVFMIFIGFLLQSTQEVASIISALPHIK